MRIASLSYIQGERMSSANVQQKTQHEFKAEMKQLLHLIVHSLYTHPEIFVRELVSNASDALNKARFQALSGTDIYGADTPFEIRITLDSGTKQFTIEDTGVGMNEADLTERLGTIASSGTLEFIQQLQEQNKPIDGNMIGQFGVGFYSVFMVADMVSVETRSIDPASKGLRWTSDGKGTYTIEEIEKETRGTKISFTLKESSAQFAEMRETKDVITKYSNFVDFPIFINDERVNAVRALWSVSKDSVTDDERNEFYKFLTHHYKNPLGHLHIALEGVVNFKALLFIPDEPLSPFAVQNDQPSIALYANKVMIQEDCKELIPEYLRFVRGVADTEDLPLNVSREVTQNSPVMAKMQKHIVKKILDLLEDWAQNDKEKFATFYAHFSKQFVFGVNDYTHREQITKLLHFPSSTLDKNALTNLTDYVARMKSEQTEIYYATGDRLETVLANPNLEYFTRHGIEVLLLAEPADIIALTSLPSFETKSIVSIDKADLKIEADPANALPEPVAQSLMNVMKQILGERVEDIVPSKRLVESPVSLVAGAMSMDAQTERLMKIIDKNYTGGKRKMEVNTAHVLIKNLSSKLVSDPDGTTLRPYIEQLYEGALLMEGNLSSPAEYVKRMTEIMTQATN